VGIGAATHEPVRVGPFTGCNATSINTAAQCEIVGTNASLPKGAIYPYSAHTMALYVFYDRSGGTGYTFHLDVCIEGYKATDCTDSTDWFNVMAQTASSNYTDIEPKVYRRTVSATDRSVFMIGTLYPRMRINNLVCTGGGCSANDKATVTVTMHADTMGFLP